MSRLYNTCIRCTIANTCSLYDSKYTAAGTSPPRSPNPDTGYPCSISGYVARQDHGGSRKGGGAPENATRLQHQYSTTNACISCTTHVKDLQYMYSLYNSKYMFAIR